MRILIIDNDKKWVNYIKRVLQNEHHLVTTLIDNDKAYEEIQKTGYDIIFCDSKAFKRNHKILCQFMLNQIVNRVIVMAALPNYKDAMYAKRIGAVDYIDKVYEDNEIIEVINENINKTQMSKKYLKRRLKEEQCL